jgi:hypothetical protein
MSSVTREGSVVPGIGAEKIVEQNNLLGPHVKLPVRFATIKLAAGIYPASRRDGSKRTRMLR